MIEVQLQLVSGDEEEFEVAKDSDPCRSLGTLWGLVGATVCVKQCRRSLVLVLTSLRCWETVAAGMKARVGSAICGSERSLSAREGLGAEPASRFSRALHVLELSLRISMKLSWTFSSLRKERPGARGLWVSL